MNQAFLKRWSQPVHAAAAAAVGILAILAALVAPGLAPTTQAARASAPHAHQARAIPYPNQAMWAALQRTHARQGIFPAVQGSGNLAYAGGPVQHNPVSYAIFWGSAWSGTDSGTAQIIRNYFSDIGGTSFENILTQYSDTSGNINDVETVGGVWFDNSAPPTDTSCGAGTVEDSSLQTEVNNAISANGWTRDSNNAIYFVFTPNGDTINGGTGLGCAANSFCAYHNWSSSDSLSYGAMPYPVSGCMVSTSPNGNVNADSLVNVTSHEEFESITDPQPASGWTDAAGYEIGDKCAWDFSAGLTHLNNGGTFEVQTEYSNATSSCVNTYGSVSPTPTPTHAPTNTPTPRPTNTPTPGPTSTPTNTPTPGPTNTPTPAPTSTPTPPPGGGISNGGFETGSFSGWTTGGQATSISSTAHSGSHSGQAGSTSPTNGDSTIAQTFTVPSGDATLSFWYQVRCPDTVTYDWATATLKDNTTGTTTTLLGKTCNNNATWVKVSGGVTAGHSETLTLISHDDNYAGDPTYTLFDDVAISAPVTNPVVNPGFETGSFSGWTTGGQATSISSTAHSGSHSGQAGSTSPTNGDSTIAQTFTIPSGGSTLSFWYQVRCPDTVTYDWATATLKDNTTGTTATILAKTCNNNLTWVKVSASVTAGHSYTLTLISHDDNYSGDPTYTLYDDVSVS